MPVIGIDLGSDTSKVALASHGGINVITNEFSQRQTPTLVAFTNEERNIGEIALNNFNFNYKNTVPLVKKMIGLKYSQIEDDIARGEFPCTILRGDDDDILIEVQYGGETKRFTPVQILGAYLFKLRTYAEAESGTKGADAVIAIPRYFTDKQRRAVLQAARLAGVNVLRLLNDLTAAALGYAIYSNLPEPATPAAAATATTENGGAGAVPATATNIAFVDVGHRDTTVSVIALWKTSATKGELKVLSSASDDTLGAYHFGAVLVDYFIGEIKTKYNLDVNSNYKAKLRLARECEKMKKIFSANPVAQMRIEAFMDDKDIAFELTRDKFLEMCKPMLARFEVPVRKAMEESGLQTKDISSVEVLGGGSYIPALRDIISTVFQMPVGQQLNAMEGIARGCALHAATLSPTIRLARNFNAHDTVPFGIALSWKKAAAVSNDSNAMDTEEEKQSEIFKVRESTPAQKAITFARNGDFDLAAVYTQPEELPRGTDRTLARFEIQGVPQKDTTSKVKVFARHNIHGIFVLDGAQLHEEIEVEETVPAPAEEQPAAPAPAAAEQAATEEGGAAPAAAEPQPPRTITRKVKKQVKTDIRVVSHPLEYSDDKMQEFIKTELAMQARDRAYQETAEAKNNVETMVYYLRDNIVEGGELFEYTDDKTRDALLPMLDEIEEWLYGEGEDTTKEEYVKKLAEIKKYSAPIQHRKKEDETRPGVVSSLLGTLDQFKQFVSTQDEKYAHIGPEDRQKITDQVNSVETWFNSQIGALNEAPKHQDPVITCAQIVRKEKEVKDVCTPIWYRPKPKPKPEPKKEQPKADQQEQPQQEQPQQEEPVVEQSIGQNKPESTDGDETMVDVD